MSRQSNEVLLQKTYQALIDGDREGLERLLAPEAEIHIPGRNTVSGDYRGIDAMLFFFKRLTALTEATYQRELIDLLIGDNHAAALVHVTGRHGARALDLVLVFVMAIQSDRVSDLRAYYGDQLAWDSFWSDQMLTGSRAPEFKPPKRPIEP
ncbi:MAG TPA: nuclear transport factor 2 family protein [Capsulimonadaceae bacterium]|nr:nuclear transport factor 2 family protein [Capsulimonadaceae bacterium]